MRSGKMRILSNKMQNYLNKQKSEILKKTNENRESQYFCLLSRIIDCNRYAYFSRADLVGQFPV